MRAPTDVRTPLSSLYQRIRSPSPHDQARQSARDLTGVDETGVRHVNFNQGEVGQPHRDKGPKAIALTALLFGDDPCHNRPPFVVEHRQLVKGMPARLRDPLVPEAE